MTALDGRDGAPLPYAVPPQAGLAAVLGRVVAALGVDMAQVFVLMPDQDVLEAVASYGMGRAGRSSLRVHVGQGFAGSIAEARRPVLLTDINERTVLDPVLRQQRPVALLGTPLLLGHELMGVLHVGTRTPREFGVEDTVELQRRAEEVVAALAQEQRSEQQSAALVLQRSLMPGIGAPVAGLEVAARYVPAEGELGGDWYDVFTLPGGRVGLVIGDVAGHGLKAAVIMGRLRSALRAYALDSDDPADVLTRLDRKLTHFEGGTVATALYAVAEAPYDTFLVSAAGHWPPFIAAPGQPAEAADVHTDLLLGTGLAAERTSHTVRLEPGASMCLFTDGLVDRRPRPGAQPAEQLAQRIERVRASLDAADDAETTCTRVLLDTLGDEPNEDDTALLVVRRPVDL